MIDHKILEWFIPLLKEAATVKGDVPGHEFHGNQYSEGGGLGGGESESSGNSGSSGGISSEKLDSYMDRNVKVSVEKVQHESIRGQNMAQGSAAGGGYARTGFTGGKKPITTYQATAEYKYRNQKTGEIKIEKKVYASQNKQTALDIAIRNTRSYIKSGVEQGIFGIDDL